ncbi:hypothetical protein ARMSODRAFT_477216 [Armillaria solidipes]|uniref:Uncharacterized protein n=1 Tax=Armillaria solidipes TaxID=1076256 RepID=A0A2H3B5R6_9AGAR|nr:hypothetical protein ARMSODRAFT_477216 [Armillaria solidipes]
MLQNSGWADIFVLNTIASFFVVRAFQNLPVKGTESRPQRAKFNITGHTATVYLPGTELAISTHSLRQHARNRGIFDNRTSTRIYRRSLDNVHDSELHVVPLDEYVNGGKHGWDTSASITQTSVFTLSLDLNTSN